MIVFESLSNDILKKILRRRNIPDSGSKPILIKKIILNNINIKDLTVNELKEILKSYNMETSGNKALLILRVNNIEKEKIILKPRLEEKNKSELILEAKQRKIKPLTGTKKELIDRIRKGRTLEMYKISELKEKLQFKGLSTKGSKEQLIKRLRNSSTNKTVSTKKPVTKKTVRKSVSPVRKSVTKKATSKTVTKKGRKSKEITKKTVTKKPTRKSKTVRKSARLSITNPKIVDIRNQKYTIKEMNSILDNYNKNNGTYHTLGDGNKKEKSKNLINILQNNKSTSKREEKKSTSKRGSNKATSKRGRRPSLQVEGTKISE